MNKVFSACLLGVMTLGRLTCAGVDLYPDRWFYCSRQVRQQADVDCYADLLSKAKRGGYNGLLFAGGLEGAFAWPQARKDLFLRMKSLCDQAGIEIIPLVWTPGYGSFLGIEPDLFEYEPVRDIPYRRVGRSLVFDSELQPLPNLDFEVFDAKKIHFPGWGIDQPGVVSFVETNAVHGGRACLRMEPSRAKNPHGHARLMRTVDVKPGRRYRFSVTVRAEGLRGTSGCLRLQAYVAKGPNIGAKTVKLPAGGTLDWTVETLDFPSGDASRVILYFGTWGGEGGTFWVDDVSVRELGLRELASRPDCRPVLRSAAKGRIFAADTDYLLPAKRSGAARDVAFVVPEGSAIAEGEQVLVDGYVIARHGPKMQCSNCMSNPRFYELIEKSAAEIQRLVAPKKWFFSVDEVRNGNTCPMCTARKTDMAHILGDCVTRMYRTVKRRNPNAMVYAWADMFSPHHNATDAYYGCKGSLVGIWDLLPKDIIMNCWSWRLAPQDMKFFTEKGFRVQAAGYYDSHKVDGDIGWIDLINTIPGATGWMYTTWQGDYEHLEEYGRLRNARSRPLVCAGESLGLVPAPQKIDVTGGELRVRTLVPVEERDASLPAEGYRLEVSSNGVRIVSSTATGAFWARQTIRQLATVTADGTRLPCVKIEDAPAYPWRGLHLDESRHFFGKDVVKRFLDQMADHKLNVFHWHLTDSAGWRLQIDAFPKLVEVGAVHTVWRDYRFFREYPGHKPGTRLGPLYYTKDDVREILAYARARHIRVVPEIEIPGHSAEVAKAYPELRCERGNDASYKMFEHDLCVGTEATYRFFEKVLDEVCALFDDEFIHIGGDECNMGNWKQCPRCQALMKREGFTDVSQLQARITRHFADYLAKRGRRIVGWSEIASGGDLPSSAAVMSWKGAAAGAWTICCNAGNFYFDYEQGIVDDSVPNYFWGWPTSLEKVYSFDGMNTMKGHERVLGGQANNWTEMTVGERELQWKVWPRACAVAELFWSNPQPKNFPEFAARVAVDRRRMLANGVNVAPLTYMDPVWEKLNRHASRIAGGTTVTGIACAISRRDGTVPRLTFNGWERKKDLVAMSRQTRIPVGPQIEALLKSVGRSERELSLSEIVALGRLLADSPEHADVLKANPPPADLSVARLEIDLESGEVRAWYAIPAETDGAKGLAAAKADFDACH